MKTFGFLVLVLFFVSCATTTYINLNTEELIYYPEKNEIISARLGDKLVEKTSRESGPAISIKSDAVIEEKAVFRCNWHSNTTQEYFITDLGNNFFSAGPFDLIGRKPDGTDAFPCSANIRWKICFRADTEDPEILQNVANLKPEKFGWDHGVGECGNSLASSDINIVTKTQEKESNLSQEFVYNGRIGNELKFIYREYKSNLARPAFTQELVYDLGISEEIGFRDLKLKIISASNLDIQYEVISNF